MPGRWIVPAFLAAVVVLSAAVWRVGYEQALDQMARRGEADLALASAGLGAQLQTFRELAVLIADHPVLGDLDSADGRAAAGAVLLAVADKTSAHEIMFAGPDGRVGVAARDGGGRDLSATAAFRRAMQGALGSEHDVLPSGARVYTYAAPVFGDGGAVQGALVVVADVEAVEWDWRGSAPVVYFTDPGGRVFITNRSELLFWQRRGEGGALAPPTGPAPDFAANRVGPHEIWRLGWGNYVPNRALHLSRELPVIGFNAEILVDVAPAWRLAGLQAATLAAICLAFGALLFLATERRRTLAQANAALETRVAARTEELSQANTHLRQAQADLVQAGKLSALGQMSAGISHELNQPLMAIQQFAENGARFLERDRPEAAADNLTRIAQLALRMARIIRNLRAFARQESAPATRVDLCAVLDTVIELTGLRIRQDRVELVYDRPGHPIWVRGGEVRLGQVFVNLVTNAIDAMAGSERKVLTLAIADAGEAPVVSVTDTGPGIDIPDKMFEPFYSTKEVGASEGMGLGLSISYGIVQSFGGDIRGGNGPHGGAVFTVRLERWQEEQAA
jgi:two-component system C4-dicarboxylate transport sensor histidine kinase DctB